jgi:hypothetical protein
MYICNYVHIYIYITTTFLWGRDSSPKLGLSFERLPHAHGHRLPGRCDAAHVAAGSDWGVSRVIG